MSDKSFVQQIVYINEYRAMKTGASALKSAKKLSNLPEEDGTRKQAFEELARCQVHSYAFKEVTKAINMAPCEPVDDLDKVHLQWSLPQSADNYFSPKH